MSRGRYARETAVTTTKTRAELEKLLRSYGATGFASAWDDDSRQHILEFKIESEMTPGVVRQVRLVVPYPDPDDPEIKYTAGGQVRSNAGGLKALEQADRQRWRQVKLLVYAKLEAVAIGISTLEREFLADVVVPELGVTIAEQLEPQLLGTGQVLMLKR